MLKETIKLVKYQVFLGEKLQVAFQQYLADNFTNDSRVRSAIMRKAMTEFLKREGYLNDQ